MAKADFSVSSCTGTTVFNIYLYQEDLVKVGTSRTKLENELGSEYSTFEPNFEKISARLVEILGKLKDVEKRNK